MTEPGGRLRCWLCRGPGRPVPELAGHILRCDRCEVTWEAGDD
jgi:hypothetical protein